MPRLPILRTEVNEGAVEEYPGQTVIPYGPANLSDESDATAIRISADPLDGRPADDWLIILDAAQLASAEKSFTITVRYNVLSVIDADLSLQRIAVYDWVPGNIGGSFNSYLEARVDLPLGRTEVTMVINQAWIDANAPLGNVVSQSGDYAFAAVRDGLLSGGSGSEMVLRLAGAGGYHEVDVTYAAVYFENVPDRIAGEIVEARRRFVRGRR